MLRSSLKMRPIWLCVILILTVIKLFVVAVPVVDNDAKLSPEYICRQSLAKYECSSTSTFWRYDASKGICTQHNGCGSNDNKFMTSDDCLAFCMGIYDGLYNPNAPNDSEENIKIKAFERVDEPNTDLEI